MDHVYTHVLSFFPLLETMHYSTLDQIPRRMSLCGEFASDFVSPISEISFNLLGVVCWLRTNIYMSVTLTAIKEIINDRNLTQHSHSCNSWVKCTYYIYITM